VHEAATCAVTWRSPLENKGALSAMRVRVGQSPASRSFVLTLAVSSFGLRSRSNISASGLNTGRKPEDSNCFIESLHAFET
jgi:hypothetical protein